MTTEHAPPTTAPQTGNLNAVDRTKADAAARAAAADKTPETLAIYTIAVAMCGPHPQGKLVSAQDLGGKAQLPRLFKLGAITLS